MPETTDETKALVRRLAFELCAQIQLNYMPEEMAECAMSLPSLYKARAFGPLHDDVEHVIGLIEQDIATIPHYGCHGCNAVFPDTDDLGIVTKSRIDLLDPGQIRPIGTCPVCGSDVHPKSPTT